MELIERLMMNTASRRCTKSLKLHTKYHKNYGQYANIKELNPNLSKYIHK